MNKFLETVDFTRASVPHRQQVKIFYMTQAYASPPTFILFTDKDVKLHFSYERFLQNQIRQKFGFVGTPIWIKNRPRTKVELGPKKKTKRRASRVARLRQSPLIADRRFISVRRSRPACRSNLLLPRR